ncbi:hypothetical protein AJ85_05800, partial [Alkalihalobacillus alcalophilus ATCC 27647 = CGMCC 1.3604]
EEERQQIGFWRKCLDDWQEYRSQGGKKTELDELFVQEWNETNEDHPLTTSTLRRKFKNWQEQGDEALVDKRGGWNRGLTEIPDVAWAIFEQYYLDEARPSISYCRKLVETWAELDEPELLPLPTYETFQRKAKKIPYAVLRFFRYGAKDADDKALPYIRRIYSSLQSNEIWVADNHTFDVMVRRPNGAIYRPYVTMYQDVRARKMVGWFVTDTPNSDANLFALRKGILRFGVPKEVYVDNGREFLVSDIGGRGRRKKKKEDEEVKPPPIFERLGIKMMNAKVRNGRAKIIERAFKQFKEEFSRLTKTFTGGHILERPERLKDVIKNEENVIEEADFIESFDSYVEGWYNQQSHKGDGMNGRTPNEVYAENLVEKRTATEEDLDLMMLRSSGALTVSRVGVTLTMYGQKLEYYHHDLVAKYQRQKVYIRYNPDDMGTVRVYDSQDRYILTAENRVALEYGASKEELRKAASEIKKQKKQIKAYKDSAAEIYTAPEAMDIMLRKARINAENVQDPTAKVINPIRANEKHVEALPKASGDDHHNSPVSISRIANNLKKFKQGGN